MDFDHQTLDFFPPNGGRSLCVFGQVSGRPMPLSDIYAMGGEPRGGPLKIVWHGQTAVHSQVSCAEILAGGSRQR